jgi:hypothetical protein
VHCFAVAALAAPADAIMRAVTTPITPITTKDLLTDGLDIVLTPLARINFARINAQALCVNSWKTFDAGQPKRIQVTIQSDITFVFG